MTTNFTTCPEPNCITPAAIEGEEMWPSTSGGMMMAKVVGACGHWFMMPAWQLDLAEVVAEFRLAS